MASHGLLSKDGLPRFVVVGTRSSPKEKQHWYVLDRQRDYPGFTSSEVAYCQMPTGEDDAKLIAEALNTRAAETELSKALEEIKDRIPGSCTTAVEDEIRAICVAALSNTGASAK